METEENIYNKTKENAFNFQFRNHVTNKHDRDYCKSHTRHHKTEKKHRRSTTLDTKKIREHKIQHGIKSNQTRTFRCFHAKNKTDYFQLYLVASFFVYWLWVVREREFGKKKRRKFWVGDRMIMFLVVTFYTFELADILAAQQPNNMYTSCVCVCVCTHYTVQMYVCLSERTCGQNL